MPNIMRADFRAIKSSDFQRVQQIFKEREDARIYHQSSIDRGLRAWRYYFALSGYQWPEKELAVLKDEDRLPYQYDVISPKINTMAGAIITDMQEPNWVPIEGEKTTTTEAVIDCFSSDKELTNWDPVMVQCVLGGLIHESWIQMIETTEYNPSGNIGLEYIRDGSLITDSYWKSNSDKQLKKAWKSQYFTAEGLAHKYDKMSDKIRQAIEQEKKGVDGAPTDAVEQRQKFAGKVGAEYEVIEEMWLEIIKTKRLVGRKEGEFKRIPFPVTDNREYLELFAEQNGIDWETVDAEPYNDIVYHATAICPSLDPHIILNDEKPRIQVKRLPIFLFTTKRHDGKNKGLVESIMDLQTTLNKRVNLESELIDKANGGMTILNEDLFDGDTIKEAELQKNLNNPKKSMFARFTPGVPTREEITPKQYPSQIMTQIELMLNTLLPITSGVSDAWSSESSQGESGVLYERKVQMNKIGTLIMDKAVKQLINNLGEAYYYQWQITYAKLPREITKRGGKEKIILNESLPDGSIKNSVEYTPRCRVIVTENLQSSTQQLRKRTMATEMLPQINPETNQLTFQKFLGMLVKNVDGLSDEEKDEFEETLKLEEAVAMTSNINLISQNIAATSGARVANEQSQMMLAKMGNEPGAGQVQEQITPPGEQVQDVVTPPPIQQPQEAAAATSPDTEEVTI
ncbi:MAG: hypothetical protein GY853_13810 [PVC group bacterium]|nr:hypothetical protein [PVC group bacterium]